MEDEPLFAERVAGIDIGKAAIMVTIRVPSDTGSGRRRQETREFRAVLKDLLALADWLRSLGVTKVGMEATGVIRGSSRSTAMCPQVQPSQTRLSQKQRQPGQDACPGS